MSVDLLQPERQFLIRKICNTPVWFCIVQPTHSKDIITQSLCSSIDLTVMTELSQCLQHTIQSSIFVSSSQIGLDMPLAHQRLLHVSSVQKHSCCRDKKNPRLFPFASVECMEPENGVHYHMWRSVRRGFGGRGWLVCACVTGGPHLSTVLQRLNSDAI